MRAYRARQRGETNALGDIGGSGELLDQLQRVTAERDALQRDVNELRGRVGAQTPAALAGEPPMVRPVQADMSGQAPLSRAQRCRLERDQRRRNP